ncbi:hypothetical protein VTO42DRAFT_4877 [Malbranchea cinnamomea]
MRLCSRTFLARANQGLGTGTPPSTHSVLFDRKSSKSINFQRNPQTQPPFPLLMMTFDYSVPGRGCRTGTVQLKRVFSGFQGSAKRFCPGSPRQGPAMS